MGIGIKCLEVLGTLLFHYCYLNSYFFIVLSDNLGVLFFTKRITPMLYTLVHQRHAMSQMHTNTHTTGTSTTWVHMCI